jgi:hypothetical protein
MFHGQGDVAHDGGQQVVVIVSDATGQGDNGFELADLPFQVLVVGPGGCFWNS